MINLKEAFQLFKAKATLKEKELRLKAIPIVKRKKLKESIVFNYSQKPFCLQSAIFTAL